MERWARERGEIQSVWLFGSRVRGNHRSDSDLDIGVRLYGDEKERLAIWIFEGACWAASLQELVSVKIHLELADPVNSPDKVWSAVQAYGRKVFDREELGL
ncbi:nucleotidyltransferase domain-containing protein [Rhodoplanes sp. SY1]|uniref:nucleotidyltransferase domain-containing protein n=1 Tax=Rhodoplanes sp. SY1 TaxID=3166646 RepID=UPI0038B555D4